MPYYVNTGDKMNDAWELYFDGACQPYNPGGTATYGWVLTSPDKKTVSNGYGVICSGKGATNNVAEMGALEAALKHIKAKAVPGPFRIYGDSKLVVMTVKRVWRCHKPHLKSAVGRIHELLEGLEWQLSWIPRHQNYRADRLANIAYEERATA